MAGVVVVMGTLALMPAPGLVTVTVLLALLGLACSFPTILLVHARAMVPEWLAGRGMTTVNTGLMIAISLMQIAVGAIVGLASERFSNADPSLGYRCAFGSIAAMAVISFLVYLRVPERRPADGVP